MKLLQKGAAVTFGDKSMLIEEENALLLLLLLLQQNLNFHPRMYTVNCFHCHPYKKRNYVTALVIK
jgi:hypothetical protein